MFPLKICASNTKFTFFSCCCSKTLEEGEKLQDSLREALSHHQFLTDCLMPALLEKLERESSDTLREADARRALLSVKVFKSCRPSLNITTSPRTP